MRSSQGSSQGLVVLTLASIGILIIVDRVLLREHSPELVDHLDRVPLDLSRERLLCLPIF